MLFERSEWNFLLDSLTPSRWVILCDRNTKEHCLPYFLEHYFEQEPALILEVEAGEQYKSLTEAERLWQEMMQQGIDRNAVLICLGGGMLTDLGGFVGSVYKRGLKTLLVPTTLLAMTDAAIGGKNGVNFLSLKNQLGTIRNPEAILIDPGFLQTLSVRELRSGFAETIKHALIGDERLWQELLHSRETLPVQNEALIKRSIQIKQQIVAQDQDDHGIRQLLNFGHSVGHALEALSHDTNAPLLHGECVALGMIAALKISVQQCGFPKTKADQAIGYLTALYEDVKAPFAESEVLEAMRHDKKNRRDEIVFSLLKDVADPEIGQSVEKTTISDALKGVLS